MHTPERIRAEAYRSLEVLRSQRYNINLPVATYVPAPDDCIQGVVYKAYTDETDHDLQAQPMKKNPDIPVVNARRLGSSKHLVITFAGHKLPATIRFSKKTSMFSSTNEGGRSKSAGRRSRSRSRRRSKSRNRNSSISAQKSCSPSQETSASMPAIHNNKNARSNGPPKSVGWSTDDPGQNQQSRRLLSQHPTPNKRARPGTSQHPRLEVAIPDPVRDQGRSHRPRPQDDQVRELTELVNSLQQQLASAQNRSGN
ncbi:hypothetical protein MRX96_016700 [Rhipicephalus microplus]